MGQHQIEVTALAIAELRALLDANRNEGAEKFINPFRAFCERHGWDWFRLEPKRLFNFNAIQLFAAYSIGRYGEERLRQLRDARYALWVYRADTAECSDEHRELDGLALPPEHPFWRYYTPKLGWRCGCSVVGVNSEAAVRRLGGELGREPPDWWRTVDPETELRPGIEEPWGSQNPPDLLLLLAALVDGHAPKPE